MVVIRSADEIIANMIELLKVVQPSADSKPGTVIRDLMVELPASQLSLLYDELANVSNLQSLRIVSGSDLDNLLSNYGLSRKSSSKASGTILLTFSSIPASIAITKGDLVFSSNGTSFAVANGISVNPSNTNLYRSIATKFRNDLDFLNISDTYAVEVTVQATTPGSGGNISKYGIVRSLTSGVSNVTNIFPFSGGSDQEDDPSFRNRGLAIFSGSSTGTVLGYRNTALTNSSVLDALVIEPGDPLMTRDGTVVTKNSDGTFTIVSEGTGGKVDIIILGKQLSEYTDSFIYQDKSNNNDPTDDKNIFVLGQITGDENKTINRKRIDNIANNVLPAQPVEETLEVTGSLSGSNFLPKSVDFLGRVTGNYEIIQDTGSFAGSPFGFDKFHWINNKIELFEEDRIKSKFNGQDNVTFTDVLEIPQIQQNITITNENSTVTAGDKSIIQLLHLPATNVTRVFNVNTGERYTITDQSVDGSSTVNSTGRIRITGNTLPSTSDVLQVDYTWIVDFDPFIDYDGKIINNNPRSADDSIDWDMSNAVRNELTVFTKNTDGAFYSGTVKHPISAILSASSFHQASGIVVEVSSGNFAGRLSVVISELLEEVTVINNIVLQNSTLEIYQTTEDDGLFSNERVVVGLDILFNCTIILPTDTPAVVGSNATVYFNEVDTFTVDTSAGNFSSNQITIPTSNLGITDTSTLLLVTYLANVQDALTASITNLSISRSGNSFNNNSTTGFTNNSVSNIIRRENQTIQLDGSSQLIVTLDITSSDFTLTANKTLLAVNLTDAKEIWNIDNPGTVTTDVDNNYVLTFTGFNTPAVGDNVVVFYTVDDIRRTQPFTFDNKIIKTSVQQIQNDTINDELFINIQAFTSDTVNFSIIDPTTGLVVIAGTSAALTAGTSSATLAGGVVVFGALTELLLKQVRIEDSIFPNNNGLYDISSVNTISNTITFTNVLDNINSNQISIVRMLDNKELWTDVGTIDLTNNKLILPSTASVNENDDVILLLFVANNLRQAPSRLAITVADQINNTGILTVSGTTVTKVKEIVFTSINNSLKQNVSEAVKKVLSLTSSGSIPSTISLARVAKLEKVTTTTGGEILSSDVTYDVLGSALKNNIFYANEMIDNDSLSNLEFTLPSTSNNLANLPKIGDKLRITCYYTTTADTESVAFTRNGTLYTNKLFAFLDKAYVSSGFTSTSVRFILSYFNQPATGSRYTAFYDYTSPKQNERIIIRYNYNRLISDTTFSIETARPINADVLVKAAKQLLVDLTLKVVIKSDFLTSAETVLQNLKDSLITAINTNKLGDILDASDLVTVAQSVSGVDRARVVYFNENGQMGNVLSLIGQRDQYFAANDVLVSQESR
jgi:hypothetical protein